MVIVVICLIVGVLVLIIITPPSGIFIVCRRCKSRLTFRYEVDTGQDMSYHETRHWTSITKCLSCGHKNAQYSVWPPRPDGM